jgi:tetratricopeptide (TPR) repeat protein
MRQRFLWFSWVVLLQGALAIATHAQAQPPDQQFQQAVALYNEGKFSEAATRLEGLLIAAPESFEVHELLGLVYSAQSQDVKANPHLEKAVRLNPNSVPARSNLAANLSRLGKSDLALEQFKKAAEIEPQNFDTNHNLGEYYIHAGQITKAIPFLDRAQQIDASSYDNGYDLSLAYLLTGKIAEARQQVQNLLTKKNTAELHNLLAEIQEKSGEFVAAAKEYETAAHMEPSEDNLFDWASELLLHETLAPAIEVFQQASSRYPSSPRLQIGLGMALYAKGDYDQAVKALLKGADLNPSDPRAYLFLSKAYDRSPEQVNDVIERFHKFAELQPRNAQAQYYYAMSLWKGKRAQDPNLNLIEIQSLLKKSVALDPKLSEAHLQLGNVYSDQNKHADAIPEYLTALKLNPDLADAYYRLGQAYVRTGEKDRAQEQFQIYQKVRTEHMADLDRQRAEVRQFVYSAKNGPAAKE